jgi:DNA-binding SARP family transcriptional activator
MASLSVWMFGKLRVQQGDTVWKWEDRCKIQDIFCYLMIHRRARHNREQLAELFWSNKPATASKKSLRQALWQLQASCAEQLRQPSLALFSTNSTWIYLHPELDLWTDVGAFEQAYECSRNSEGLDAARAQTLRQAVNLYHGDLLEGWYQDWCLCERERLQHMYLTMLYRLIGYCEKHREYDAGLDYGERILKYDPACERAHQHMMRLKSLAGDRTGAMRQYDRCVKALREELGVQPSHRTRELLDQVRSDLVPLPAIPDSMTPPNTATPQIHLSELLNQLESFQATLGALQQQAEQWIKLIEQLGSNRYNER